MEKKITNNIYFCLLHTFNYLSFFSFTFFFTFDSQLCPLAFAMVYRLTQVANRVPSHFSHSSSRAIRHMLLVDNGCSPFQKKSNRQRISKEIVFISDIDTVKLYVQFFRPTTYLNITARMSWEVAYESLKTKKKSDWVIAKVVTVACESFSSQSLSQILNGVFTKAVVTRASRLR